MLTKLRARTSGLTLNTSRNTAIAERSIEIMIVIASEMYRIHLLDLEANALWPYRRAAAVASSLMVAVGIAEQAKHIIRYNICSNRNPKRSESRSLTKCGVLYLLPVKSTSTSSRACGHRYVHIGMYSLFDLWQCDNAILEPRLSISNYLDLLELTLLIQQPQR